MSVTVADYRSELKPAWCPGCGNFPILEAVKRALAALDLPPERVLVCTGIGQAPKLPHYMRVNTLNGLHGRELASATAAKLAAADLKVIVHAGDGGAYGEGGNHFLHALRRNPDLTLVVHDNRIYGLTKGQASPTTPQGDRVKLHPRGVASRPLNPLALAIGQACSFVAQASAAHPEHLLATLTAAIAHRGLAFVNVLQPCVTWDKVRTYQFYQERGRVLGPDHDPADQTAALALVLKESETLPLGLIYKNDRPAYDDIVLAGVKGTLRDKGVEPERAMGLMARFR
jgi:2-oxoglutarate ferredoxin oxidoreductase subunit beta